MNRRIDFEDWYVEYTNDETYQCYDRESGWEIKTPIPEFRIQEMIEGQLYGN